MLPRVPQPTRAIRIRSLAPRTCRDIAVVASVAFKKLRLLSIRLLLLCARASDDKVDIHLIRRTVNERRHEIHFHLSIRPLWQYTARGDSNMGERKPGIGGNVKH